MDRLRKITIIICQPGEFWTQLQYCRYTSPCWAWTFFPLSLLFLSLVLITFLLFIFCLPLTRFLYTKALSRTAWTRVQCVPLSRAYGGSDTGHAVAGGSQTVACFQQTTPGGYVATITTERWLWLPQQHATGHSGVCNGDRYIAEIQNTPLTSEPRVSCQVSCVSVTRLAGAHSDSLGSLFFLGMLAKLRTATISFATFFFRCAISVVSLNYKVIMMMRSQHRHAVYAYYI